MPLFSHLLSYIPPKPPKQPILGLLQDLFLAIRAATPPTLLSILLNPTLLLRPFTLRRVFMAHVWEVYGNPTDQGGKPVKEALIRPNARGVVLDLGASTSYSFCKPSLPYHLISTNLHTKTNKDTAIQSPTSPPPASKPTSHSNQTVQCTNTSEQPQTPTVTPNKQVHSSFSLVEPKMSMRFWKGWLVCLLDLGILLGHVRRKVRVRVRVIGIGMMRRRMRMVILRLGT